MPPAQKSKLALFFGHVFIIIFLALLTTFGIRSFQTEDFRYGWHMFRNVVFWDVEYAAIQANGSQQPFFPGKELKGKTAMLRGRATRAPAGTALAISAL